MRNDSRIKLKTGGRITIRYACEEVAPDTYFDHLHDHKSGEICIIISGEMLHIANGKSYILRRGDVFFCRPGELHYALCREKSVYERYALWLPQNTFSEIESDSMGFLMMNNPALGNLFTVRSSRRDILFLMLESVKPLLLSGEEANRLLLYGKIAEIVAFLSSEAAHFAGDHTGINPESNAQPIVNRTISYIRDNFRQPGGVGTIAENFKVNRDYLSRVFKKYTGITLHDYITDVRLNESKIMLLRGAGVTETAFACGFNSTSYFIRVFRANTGITPADFGRSGKNVIIENR